MRFLGYVCVFAYVCMCVVAAQQQQQFHFLSLGDWGTGTDTQKAVATQMAITAEQYNPRFLVALGDNFYESGVSTDTDALWQDYYTDVYNQTSLQIPWYPIMGNHDWKGHPEAQIEFYTNARDSRWVFPDYYYTKHLTSTSCNGGSCVDFSMDLIFIDTAILAPDLYKGQFSMDPKQYTDKHMRWLEEQLASSNATWIIVLGHYPVLSLGEHGDTLTLDRELKPMLERYNVDLYICGHDHTLQHISNNKVSYLVNGNGARTDGRWSTQPSAHEAAHQAEGESVDFVSLEHGFMLHEVNHENLTTYVINQTGHVIYTSTIQPSDKSRPPSFWNSPVAMIFLVGGAALALVLVGWVAYKRVRSRRGEFARVDTNDTEPLRNREGHSPRSDDDEVVEIELSRDTDNHV